MVLITLGSYDGLLAGYDVDPSTLSTVSTSTVSTSTVSTSTIVVDVDTVDVATVDVTDSNIDNIDNNNIKSDWFKPSFGLSAHLGCVKALTSSGHLMVSGSTDETVKVFNVKRRKEERTIMCGGGTVSSLSFFGVSYLLCGGDCGSLQLWRCSDFQLATTLKGHKGQVTSVAFHPEGRVALTASDDGTLRQWDMTRGTCAVSTKIKKSIHTHIYIYIFIYLFIYIYTYICI
eukprot:GHVR01141866.1.p1 GENE.GHVR01141866.1~~GHVR01141866.1.p1  ORF type:complete len:231 (+),score=67.98 GHVR01141866.1:203-895(+)